MTDTHARQWDQDVKPTIDRIEFERLTGMRPNESPRADAYWRYSWSQVWRLFSVASRLVINAPGAVGVSLPSLWAVEAATPFGARPIGLLLGLSRYPFPEPASTAAPIRWQGLPVRALFAWLLTATPGDTLIRWEIPPSVQIGRVLLDTVIQCSLAAGHFGHVLLHADEHGDAPLTDFYAGCGMDLLESSDFPNVSSQRANDGRYFLFRPAAAGAFAMTYAHLRQSAIGHLSTAPGPIAV